MPNPRNPTPQEMSAALLEAAQEGRWNHWRHEFREHADDWSDVGDMRRPLSPDDLSHLPEVVATYPSTEQCTYIYRGRRVWGYYARNLPFGRWRLSHVVVVYDPVAQEIIHCMRAERAYFRGYSKHRTADFVEVR